MWVRYTTLRYADGRLSGALWFSAFGNGAPVGRRRTVGEDRVAYSPDSYVEVDGAVIGPGTATGALVVDGSSASWDLTFDEGLPAFRHLHPDWLYAAPLPRTKVETLHPASTFTGSVTVDGQVVDVTGWRGMVGHNWGAEHAEEWVWLQGNDIDVDGCHLDVAAGRLLVGGRLTPWVANGRTGARRDAGTARWSPAAETDDGERGGGGMRVPAGWSGRRAGGPRAAPPGELARLGLRGAVRRTAPGGELVGRGPQPHHPARWDDAAPGARRRRGLRTRLARARRWRTGGSRRVARVGSAGTAGVEDAADGRGGAAEVSWATGTASTRSCSATRECDAWRALLPALRGPRRCRGAADPHRAVLGAARGDRHGGRGGEPAHVGIPTGSAGLNHRRERRGSSRHAARPRARRGVRSREGDGRAVGDLLPRVRHARVGGVA